VLLALAAGHLALIPASGSVVALAAVLVLAGGAIAPTFATVYAMVDSAAGGGALVDRVGVAATFGLAGSAGLLAVLAALPPRGARTRALGEIALTG
jgi:hypothetical protein